MNNNLKAFDLTKALAGEKVVTRDGREVTEIHYFKTFSDIQKLRAVINGCLNAFNDDGTYSYHDSVSPFDLFMAPVTVERWVNVYKANQGNYFVAESEIYETEEKAKAHASTSMQHIGTYPIQITI